MSKRSGLLLVGNHDSDVGYAWWLMEGFWAAMAEAYQPSLVSYVAFPQVTKVSRRLFDAPLRVIEQDFRSPRPADLLAQFKLLRRLRIKTLYLSDWSTWKFRYLLYRIAGVETIIVHDHTPGLRITPSGGKRMLKQMLNRAPMIAADGVIGATEFVRRRLIEVSCVPPSRAWAVPNGLAPQPNRTTVSSDVYTMFDIPRGRAIMVMVSRANRYKNVEFVLECLASLKEKHRDGIHFLFIGDGPHLEDFRTHAARLGVDGLSTFPGRLSDVAQILPGCTMAFHPARGEVGYSLSILEYMRAGLPVIVPDNPSVCGATSHGKTGLVYPEGNVEEASACVLRLAGDKALRARLGREAAQVVDENYRLDRTHEALLDACAGIDPRFPRKVEPVGQGRVSS
ncbi:glycosyltransferase family 4 protein [Lentisalinibacter sediminis]|uniref:glycosyltransferase family 4 protein n=1 Tax=Lentisalinibacter sediminis TaxID=2992237 RepID=UPI0038665F3E